MSVEYPQTFGPSLLAIPSLRLADADERAARYVDSKMIDWFIQEVVDPTKKLAYSRRHAQRFIDSIKAEKKEFLKVRLVVDEIPGPTGINLNELLEFGWRGPYMIYGNPWLHWTNSQGEYFRRKVEHPGFPGYHLLDSVRDQGFYNKFMHRIIRETNQYMEAVKFS